MTFEDTEVDHRAELVEAVTSIVDRAGISAVAPQDSPDTTTFAMLKEAGFAALDIGEDAGGSGGTLVDAITVVTAVAAAAALTPLTEHGVLASWAMAQSGLDLPGGILTFGVATNGVTVREERGELLLNGVIEAVPWAAVADAIVVVVQDPQGVSRIALISTADDSVTVESGTDLTGAPLNDVRLTNAPAAVTAVAALSVDDVLRRGALAVTAAIAGAARTVCELSQRHARQRTQFGRPLLKFQAVAQRLAELDALTTAVEVATLEAARDARIGPAPVSVAAATVMASIAARDIAASGHQIHGAIGFTSEYALGRSTTSLWSWRDRYGSAEYWADSLASEVLDGGTDVWGVVTGHANTPRLTSLPDMEN